MADYVYRTVMHDIKQNILNNQYKGMRLPDERSLAEHYQVSRSSMKRALELLAQQGIVFKKRGSGTLLIHYICAIRQCFVMMDRILESLILLKSLVKNNKLSCLIFM